MFGQWPASAGFRTLAFSKTGIGIAISCFALTACDPSGALGPADVDGPGSGDASTTTTVPSDGETTTTTTSSDTTTSSTSTTVAAGDEDAAKPIAATACPADLAVTAPDLTAPTVEVVKEGLKGGEGIVWVEAEQKLYFSEINRNRGDDGIERGDPKGSDIVRLDPESGETEVWVEASGTNGLALSPDSSSLIAAVTDGSKVSSFDLADKTATEIADSIGDAPLDGVNDVAVKADGTLYISGFSADALYGISPDGVPTILDSELIRPNGVALSPDQKTLYVTGLDDNPADVGGIEETTVRVYSYAVGEDGSLSDKQEFAELDGVAADGMAVDCAGNIYATQRGVIQVVSPEGTLLGSIEVKTDNENIVSNIAFGGENNSTLFATVESTGSVEKEDREYSIRSIDLGIPGLPY